MEESEHASDIKTENTLESNTVEIQETNTAEEEQNLLDTSTRSERRLIEDEEEDEEYSANVAVSLDPEQGNPEQNNPSDSNATTEDSAANPASTYYGGRMRTPAEMQQLIQIWKRGNGVVILYMLPMTISLITVLMVDWTHTCDKPLKDWAITQTIIQSSILLINYLVLSRLPSTELPPETQQRMLNSLSLFYLLNRVLNFTYMIWFIVGMVWTFQSHSCSETSPFLYRMCFSLIIIQLVMFCFIVLFCCCSCAIVLLRVFVYPNGIPNRTRGASKRIIRSLPSKKFEAESIPKDDANCAICLSDYEVNEEIRYLPCNHHFHASCVDQWLFTNKTCPFCKRDVDKPAEETNATTVEVQVEQ